MGNAKSRNHTTASTFGSVDELANELGVSRRAVYNGLNSGAIPHIRLGKRFILPKVAIQEWLRAAGRQVVNNA